MSYDIVTRRELRPDQIPRQDAQLIMVTADRYQRASAGMQEWATKAKESIEFVEGKQWSSVDLIKNEREGRPSLTFNKLNNLLRLVMGYHKQTQTDAKYSPDDEGAASSVVASGLTKLSHKIGEMNEEPYIETEMVLDGLVTGRGYIDQRLQFENNMFGEIMVSCRDPFSIKLDPDGSTYDLNKSCNFLIEDRFVSIDEIESTYGAGAAALLYPLVFGGFSGMPGGSMIREYVESITPWRNFGGDNSIWGPGGANHIEAFLSNAFDTARKTIRLVDMQHKVRVPCRYWADLETGDLEMIPESFSQSDIGKALLWAEARFASMGKPNPIRVIHRMGEKFRWTTMVGDIIVYDKWSPYQHYTMTPYFPYFRRGVTRGMMEDLLDPQREVNKRRSANIDITTRSAHSGWKIHADSMTNEEEAKLKKFGAAPGIHVKWKGQAYMKPEKIESSAPPQAFERLELRSADDLKEISGVNDSLLGLVDKVQSGRALEARQKQGVMTIEMYMTNRTRTKKLMYRNRLDLIQSKYTQARVFRFTGEAGKPDILQINVKTAAGMIVNDVTLGKYTVSIDESPTSASAMAAQFEEVMDIVKEGALPKEILTDVIIDVSTLPHKAALKKRAEIMMASLGLPTIDQLESGEMPPMAMGPDGAAVPASQAGAGMNPAINGNGSQPDEAPPPHNGAPGSYPTPGHPNAGPLNAPGHMVAA